MRFRVDSKHGKTKSFAGMGQMVVEGGIFVDMAIHDFDTAVTTLFFETGVDAVNN